MQDAFRIYAEIAPATWWKSIRTVKLASLESDAIGFRQGDVFAGLKDEPRKLDLIGTLGFNVFRGNVRAQVEFSDFRLACLKKTATPLAEMLRRAAAS